MTGSRRPWGTLSTVDSPAELIQVLMDVRAALARPDNNFDRSTWPDAETALAELDASVDRLRAGGPVTAGLVILFAPTGPVQEVALSSGWGDEFLVLAGRFDAAAAG